MSDAATGKDACRAVLTADGSFECYDCALAWDDGDTRPGCSRLSFSRLVKTANEAAERIEQSQRAIREAFAPGERGYRQFRDQDQLRRRLEFLRMVVVIEKLREAEAEKQKRRA